MWGIRCGMKVCARPLSLIIRGAYESTELVVRSSQLLLMMEDSLEKEIGNTGKAIVIVS